MNMPGQTVGSGDVTGYPMSRPTDRVVVRN
jgi:hypothetical protein